jgi:hypothetical protein
MNDIDQKIQAALRREQAGNMPAGEPNLAEEVIIAFRGRHRWFSALAMVLNLFFFAGAVWAAARFIGTDSVPAQLQWGALTFLFLLIVMFIKLWFWLEMHTNRVLRELKRVELLLVTRQPPTQANNATS